MDIQEIVKLKKDIDSMKNTLKLINEKKIASAEIILHADCAAFSVEPVYESDEQMLIATAGELIENSLSIMEDQYREILQELIDEVK